MYLYRYPIFGGIKLGAGGLIRAYGSSVSETLKEVEFKRLFRARIMEITFDYSYSNEITRLLEKKLKSIKQEIYKR